LEDQNKYHTITKENKRKESCFIYFYKGGTGRNNTQEKGEDYIYERKKKRKIIIFITSKKREFTYAPKVSNPTYA
jgi:hypothetical protein